MTRASMAFFAEDFDRPDVCEQAAAESVVPTFTAEDMDNARAAAWREGHDAGRQAGEQAVDRQLQQLLDVLADELSRTRMEFLAQSEATVEELARLMLGALGRMMPAFCARHGAAEIQAVVAEILPPLLQEAHVRVQVAPEQIAGLRRQIARLDPDLARIIRVLPGPLLGPSDISIRWQHGEAVRDAAGIWAGIAAILAPHGLMDNAPLADQLEKEAADVE